MGACFKKPAQASSHENGHDGHVAQQGIKQSSPDITTTTGDVAFPRYAVLPPIDTKKDPGSAASKDKGTSDQTQDILNMYNCYKDPEASLISAQGIQQLCDDLELNPEDFRVLVLAYSLEAETMCQFTEQEFLQGCTKLHINNIQTMKESIPRLLKEIQGSAFGPFYRWAYKFSLDQQSGQRTLPTDMALLLWTLVFSNDTPPILNRWLAYVESCPHIKGISKDTWDMFLIFVEQVGDNLRAYDDTEAWPSLLDDFVEHELENEEEAEVGVKL